MTRSAIVVGAGLAGLLTAAHLLERGVGDLLVLDASTAPGGVARTRGRHGYSLEPAAGTLLLPDPHLSPLLERAGIGLLPAPPSAARRYVFSRGRLHEVPRSPRLLASPLLSAAGKLRAGLEPLVGPSPTSEDESLEAFLRRRLGSEAGGLLAWLVASGVFAGDPARLSARSAAPILLALEEEAGSLARGAVRRLRAAGGSRLRRAPHLPRGGMVALVDALARQLGARLRLGFPVRSARPAGGGWVVEGDERLEAEQVVLACAPPVASRLVGGELGPEPAGISSAPVVVVGLGGARRGFPIPEGFGALVAPEPGMLSVGVLFESSYAPHRAPPGHSLVKVIAGGARRPDLVEWDEARIVDQVGREVARVLGGDVEASFVEVVRHRPGIPQYELGHGERLRRVDARLPGLPGLHLTGWGYRGVGVGHLAADAARVASRVAGGTV